VCVCMCVYVYVCVMCLCVPAFLRSLTDDSFTKVSTACLTNDVRDATPPSEMQWRKRQL